MSFLDLKLKKAYSSDSDDLLNDFYIPVLKESENYYRISGFFSSTSLAISACGIVGLLENDGNIKMIVSPKLSRADIDTIMQSHDQAVLSEVMNKELEDIEDEFIKNHIFALGWMIAHSKLEIKVAIMKNSENRIMDFDEVNSCGMFHQKVGILEDKNGNRISFSGSLNETASGWINNIEEFKVFKSYEMAEKSYVDIDVEKFFKFWDQENEKIKIMDIPEAVKKKLIEITPVDFDYKILSKYYKNIKKTQKPKVNLYKYQEDAVLAWVNNGRNGIFEMATGTGKTFTSLACCFDVATTNKKWITIIACPQSHLIRQWENEVKKFGINYDRLFVADSTNYKWKSQLTNAFLDLTLNQIDNFIVITSHRTLSSKFFIEIVEENKRDIPILLIADEVHGLGSSENQKGLLESYEMRLGLSATPKRWFDDNGTDVLYTYFNKNAEEPVFEFSLKKAINTINPATGYTYLTPYLYKPVFIRLTIDELEEYIETTKKIIKKIFSNKNKDESDLLIERLIFSRANILKNADEKFDKLIDILDDLEEGFSSLLIYCSPEQVEKTMKILKDKSIIAHRFTQGEGTQSEYKYGGISEREYILKKFSEGEYKALVAIKCLDEGVDIPQAKFAVLMASSTNPREYIQRIGRIIRRHHGKEKAVLYDLILIPSIGNLPKEWKEIETRIFEKELMRAEEIAKISSNNAEALMKIYEHKIK